MKKYLLIATCFLVGCSPKAATSKTFICINPAMSIQGVRVDTENPNVKEEKDHLEILTADGNTVRIPKGLCLEIRKP